MAHNHGVYDTDLHFTINPITRQIINESGKTKLVQFDHNSERFTFDLPRIVDGHDMSRCSKVEIHYINIAANRVDKFEDVYEVDDLKVNFASSDNVQFTWLISGNATQYAGSLNFLIRFVCLTGTEVDYAWHTDIFSGIEIAGGMNNGEAVVMQYADVLEAWKKEVLSGLESPPFFDVVRYVANDSVVISEQTLTSGMWNKRQMDIISGIPYAVYINGAEYFCVAYENDGGIILGNFTIANSSANVPHNNEPFYIYWAGGSATAGMFGMDGTLSYPVTLKVTSAAEVHENKIPEEYLPHCVVKSVNGKKPDADGNVEIETGGGLNNEAVNLLIDILRHATYDEDMSSLILELSEALKTSDNTGGGDTGGDTGDNTGGGTGNDGGDTESGLLITDDGNGNVTITASGKASITDDGNGNVTIQVSDDVSITDDGNGNVIIA